MISYKHSFIFHSVIYTRKSLSEKQRENKIKNYQQMELEVVGTAYAKVLGLMA